jgi:hypothetical protein
MSRFYATVAARAEHRCEYCRALERLSNIAFEVEHIEPTAEGGSDPLNNLALACRSCNLFKSDALTGKDPETDAEIALFHPRRDNWTAHFRVDTDSGEIIGLTPTGRATVSRLQMNRPIALNARRLWIQFGVFP